jgi:hypothetical protein
MRPPGRAGTVRLMDVTQPVLGAPEPTKPPELLATTSAEQDPQAIMQGNIKTKAGSGALARVQEYLTGTGHRDGSDYTSLYTDKAYLYTYGVLLQNWNFTETMPGMMVPEVVAQSDLRNPTPATISDQFSYSKKMTDTFTFAFTEGIKVGVSAKFTAGVPVAKTEWTVSGEINFSATQTQTATNETTWTKTTTVNVPANTKVHVTGLVSVVTPMYSFTASAVVVNGKVNIAAYDSATKLWDDLIIPLEVLLPELADRSIPLSGSLNAKAGLRTYVELEVIP